MWPVKGTPLSAFEQGRCIRRVRFARRHGRRERRVDDTQAIVELAIVADDDDVIDEATVGEGIAQLRPDARRVAGRDNEWFGRGHA